MERLHPFWSKAKHQAYTEAALVVCAREKEPPTPRMIIESISQDSRDWCRNLPRSADETYRDTFIEQLTLDEILTFDNSTGHYSLGKWGSLLVNEYLESML